VQQLDLGDVLKKPGEACVGDSECCNDSCEDDKCSAAQCRVSARNGYCTVLGRYRKPRWPFRAGLRGHGFPRGDRRATRRPAAEAAASARDTANTTRRREHPPRSFNARLVAATNRNLEREVEAGGQTSLDRAIRARVSEPDAHALQGQHLRAGPRLRPLPPILPWPAGPLRPGVKPAPPWTISATLDTKA